MLAARMRQGDAWSNASILNLSSRGLLLHAASPPPRGTYIEVRRGTQVIIGRVIWAEAGRFGVRAQDRLAIDALITEAPSGRRAADAARGEPVRGRTAPPSEALEWRYAQSLEKGRATQFVSIAGAAIILAACAYQAVADTFSQPLLVISTKLAGAN